MKILNDLGTLARSAAETAIGATRWSLHYAKHAQKFKQDPTPIPALPFPRITIDRESFASLLESPTPVVVEGFAPTWEHWNHCTLEWLKACYGQRTVPVRPVNSPGAMNVVAFERVKYATLLDRVFSENPEPLSHRGGMLGLAGFEGEMPGYFNDLINDLPGYRLVREDTSLWTQGAGNVSTFHIDVARGARPLGTCLVMIRGRKRAALVPPSGAFHLHPRFWFNPDEDAPRLENPFDESVNQFPRYLAGLRYEGELERGDMLYIPPYWWHALVTLESAISLSIRYEKVDGSMELAAGSAFQYSAHNAQAALKRITERVRRLIPG